MLPAINDTTINDNQAEAWDEFVDQELDSSLLQSWMWGEFQKTIGRPIARLSVKQDGRFSATALLVLIKLPLGFKYVYCPRGPVVKSQSHGQPQLESLKEILGKIRAQAKEWEAVFIRIDPPLDKSLESNYLRLGYRQAANEIQPRVTARLDLDKSRDEILASMKSKTRYNIRLSSRKEISVRQSIDPDDIESFLKLNRETTARDKFFGHPDNYYRQQFNILGKAGLLKLFVASFKAEPLAIIAVAWQGRTATYLHGTSSNRERNRMPAFLVHWQAIKYLQSRGLKWYDFHGVAPSDDPNHPWAGITRFKLGFGAKRITYMGALDLPLRPLAYFAYKTRLKLRKSDGR